jgi:4-hydroxybenzoate polyprenyltransferase
MLAYCLRLRDFLVIDVLTLAAGFVLRVVAGAMAADLAVSPGMLAFWLLFFFGLALLKRYAELVTMRSYDGPQARARAYLAKHAGPVAVVGCASGYLALLALALQTWFGQNLHGRYDLIWVAFVLLAYWVTHMWLMARHGRIHRDPLAFALSDPASRIVGAMTLAVMLIAT